MKPTTRLLLIRHGQTEWKREERFRGRADVPLNDTGLAQAEATGRRAAAEWKPTAIYSSPLSRSVKTSEAVAKHFGLTVQIHLGLSDIDYGEWQGLTPDEARMRWPEIVEAWYTTPHLARIPGGETLDDVRARGMAVVKELVAKHEAQTMALVGHTVINRAILLGVLGLGNDASGDCGKTPAPSTSLKPKAATIPWCHSTTPAICATRRVIQLLIEAIHGTPHFTQNRSHLHFKRSRAEVCRPHRRG